MTTPAFRLPDSTHPGVVHLRVSDLSRSLAYYEQVIGLRAYETTSSEVVLGVARDDRPLVKLHTAPGVTPASRGAFGLYHFAILLPDRPALGRFAAHVASLQMRVGMADHLVSEALYLNDPDGLGIEVYADRPRPEWLRRNGELAMTTDPLDVGSVIDAGRGKAWSGAPSGTTMGHVHLHVGNLDQAEAFYHHGLGFDKTVWSYPGALFMSAGGYHHHLAVNTWAPGPSPASHQARLLEWELVVPSRLDAATAAENLEKSGYHVDETAEGYAAVDPWGTRVHIR
jgi:catechol 2,3-dioxygenase